MAEPPCRRISGDDVLDRDGNDLETAARRSAVDDGRGTSARSDVTSLVRAAVAGQLGSSRYTRIMLIDTDAPTNLSYRSYYTPDAGSVDKRPALVVSYTTSSKSSGSSSPAPSGGSSPSTGDTAPSGSGSTLRLLQYNVYHGGTGTDGVYKPNRIIDWIVKIDPDVDYAFYSRAEKHLTLKSVQAVDTRDANGIMPSDHRPLVATFSVD
jgi:hypothetical protein